MASSLPLTKLYRNLKLTVAYDGSSFLGFQETAFGLSVEGILRSAVKNILKENVLLQAASRTDKGVHAKGQVVNFFTQNALSTTILKKALNATLPFDIRILNVEEMELSFHPTLDAVSKEYHYHISLSNTQSPFERFHKWHVYYPLDLQKIERALPYFLEEKDFSSFCNARENSQEDKRTTILNLSMKLSEENLCFIITGKRFLYKMVRNIVGTLIAIGRGAMDVDEISSIFEKKDRKLIGMTAPAHGLFLMNVVYD